MSLLVTAAQVAAYGHNGLPLVIANRDAREVPTAGLSGVGQGKGHRRTGGRRLTADANPFDAPRPLGWRALTPWPALLALVAALALSAGLPRHYPAAPEAAA